MLPIVAATFCVSYPPDPLSVKGACRFAPNTNPKGWSFFGTYTLCWGVCEEIPALGVPEGTLKSRLIAATDVYNPPKPSLIHLRCLFLLLARHRLLAASALASGVG